MDSQEMRRLINGILSSREFFGKYDINSDIDTFNNFVRKNGIDPFIDILTTEKPTNRLDDIAMPVNQYYIASLLLKVSRHLIPQIQDGLQVVMDKITIHQDNDLRERMVFMIIVKDK